METFGSGFGTGKVPTVVHRQWTHEGPPVALTVRFAVGVGSATLGTFGCRFATTTTRRVRTTIWVFVFAAFLPKPVCTVGTYIPVGLQPTVPKDRLTVGLQGSRTCPRLSSKTAGSGRD